eukprot:TRINITY_DN50246_c0_g1_i1.p1 TRINITY_DN50246_c0_g1~~TRINITY_DN50246_c0_g1_i1.p1  ORF type:complete len:343 (-),score=88.90 TRINITY_DN50246_c0_g1_i1:87-1115(-)
MSVSFPGDRDVPWFPQNGRDLDSTTATLDGSIELIAPDHPGFSDQAYIERRNQLAEQAASYRHGEPLPRIEYTQSEQDTWKAVVDKLDVLHQKHACAEYLRVRPLMEQHCGFRADNIPQLEDVSCFLQDCTGFRIRPVTGLLSARDFLNALAFRVFFSTQYIRHHSRPLYTPEPDLLHEMLGHVPMFADPDFADFSHSIGVASLGASDEDIERLATCYWFSVEFGMLQEQGELKAYGAGLLSSFGELEYACNAHWSPSAPPGLHTTAPSVQRFDPFVASATEYPITEYQPVYFVADSMLHAKEAMKRFCESLKRPFHATLDPLTRRIHVDRAVKRLPKPTAP